MNENPFAAIDKDGSGTVTWEEFEGWIEEEAEADVDPQEEIDRLKKLLDDRSRIMSDVLPRHTHARVRVHTHALPLTHAPTHPLTHSDHPLDPLRSPSSTARSRVPPHHVRGCDPD